MKTFATLLLLCVVNTQAVDPSTQALTDVTGQTKFSERWRIVTDLDGDGADDLLLSDALTTFGNMGGGWTVYLNRKAGFLKLGRISAHPRAISIEPDHSRILKDPAKRFHARIWVYLRSSGREGSFGYYRIGEDSVATLAHLDLYPGDAGTKLGRALYDATFKTSIIKFRLEMSLTDADGIVRWTRPDC